MNNSTDESPVIESYWNRFWFTPRPVQGIACIRGLLCVITAIYFIGAMMDASQWYSNSGPFSQSNITNFFKIANLQGETRWILSPLFLIESVTGSPAVIHVAYLLLGVGLCVASVLGRGGRWVNWALWIVFAGWANRILFLAGPTEILLSLSLFAAAIAPPAMAWRRDRDADETSSPAHWSAGFAIRLMAVQITLFGLLTFATMLSQNVWWNGYAAYAMNAPSEDRTIDWSGLLASPYVHELLTHYLTLALPVGLALAWRNGVGERRARQIGIGLLIAWCILIACLGSHWLYAATFAVACLAIGDLRERQNNK